LEKENPDVEDILPLTPLQEGLLFHALYESEGGDVYVGQIVLGIEGGVEKKRLKGAVERLLRRHGNLRVSFEDEGWSRPVQVIRGEMELDWEEMDLRGKTAQQQREEVKQIFEEERRRRFDLKKAPQMRFRLIQTGTEEYRLGMTFHHILLDGW